MESDGYGLDGALSRSGSTACTLSAFLCHALRATPRSEPRTRVARDTDMGGETKNGRGLTRSAERRNPDIDLPGAIAKLAEAPNL